MRNYEIMYILNPAVDGMKELQEKLHGIVTSNGGEITKTDDWGVKEFAYEIDKINKGHYVVLTAKTTQENIKEFGRVANIEEGLIRHIAINLDMEKEFKPAKKRVKKENKYNKR